jgi:arylsulfatase A-like enzyme
MFERKPTSLVMIDDMGYSDLGCYGGEVRTPTLDAQAENGVWLARFHNCAQCCPSRASLMSGLSPYQAGVGDMNEQGAANEFWRRVGSAVCGTDEVMRPQSFFHCPMVMS